MPDATRSGILIHFEVEGAGPAIIIHHGFLGSPTAWRDAGYVDALSDQYQVILIDARGHGQSDKPRDTSAYAYGELAADVIAVLDAMGLERAHYWGYSMGGCVGFRLARGWPRRVRSLVLGGAQPFPVAEADLADATLWAHDLRSGMQIFIERLEHREGPLPPEVRTRWLTLDGPALGVAMECQVAEDRAGMAEPFDDLTMPFLLYAGTGDHFARDLPRTVAALPDARAVLFGGMGHEDAFDNTEIVPYVKAFLARVGVQ